MAPHNISIAYFIYPEGVNKPKMQKPVGFKTALWTSNEFAK